MNRKQVKPQRNNRDPTWNRSGRWLWQTCMCHWKMGLRGFIAGFIKVGVLSYLFYRHLLLTGVLALLSGICGIYIEYHREQKQWRDQINLEFREGLQGIATALNAGYSIENAFSEAGRDLELLYGNTSALAPEFHSIVTKCQLNYPVEEALTELSNRTGLEDIRRFAEVFQTAKRTGGDLIAITRTTADRISEKIELRREINAMSAGKRMEARVMNGVPLGMILYFWICSPGFLDCFYHGKGRSIMTCFLIVYLLAYYWSERIVQIDI